MAYTVDMKITRYRDIPQFIQHGQYEVDVSPDRLIKNIDEFVVEHNLQLDPDFQRGHVWNAQQQMAFIEFFLRGGKTAKVVYLNFPSWKRNATTDYDDFVVVDGKQRLEAWRKFFNNEIKAFGAYAKDFTDSLRHNSGGVVHTDEEIDRVKKLLKKELRQKK